MDNAHSFPLLLRLAQRELLGRYRGSVAGAFWSLLHPLLMLGVYTFVFGVVLPARWPEVDGHLSFALNLFAGLLVHNFFSECVTRAPGLVLENTNYVKKVVFPLELLAPGVLLSALFHALVGVALLTLVQTAVRGLPGPWALLLPLVWAPLALLTLGLSWFLAALGVYLRDTAQVMGVVTSALLFLSPVFYPLEALPAAVRDWTFLNPLTLPILETRKLLLAGGPPLGGALAAYWGVGLMVAWAGYRWFQATRRGFADVV